MTRGELVESVHAADVVLLDPDGTERLVAGAGAASDAPMLPRSALKPAQAVAVLEAGARLDDAELALAAASHSGEDVHLAAVAALLARSGLDETALACPPDRPLGAEAARAWGPRAPSASAMNCSGKHAAMLAACVSRGWDVAGYAEPGHPLQVLVADVVTRLAGPVATTTVDGCGAPAFAVPLRALARLGHRLVTAAPGTTTHRVAAAMRAHPELVAGPDRLDTVLMTALPGSLAKSGAEGVLLASTPAGHVMAIKVVDGSARALGPASLAALRSVDQDIPDGFADLVAPLVRGGGRPVGHHRVRA